MGPVASENNELPRVTQLGIKARPPDSWFSSLSLTSGSLSQRRGLRKSCGKNEWMILFKGNIKSLDEGSIVERLERSSLELSSHYLRNKKWIRLYLPIPLQYLVFSLMPKASVYSYKENHVLKKTASARLTLY